MECRICHQPIHFIRGQHPGHKRRATLAVHDADLSRVLAETHGEIVHPHPGAARRLRQPLEAQHNNNPVTEKTTSAAANAPQATESVAPERQDISQGQVAATAQSPLAEELQQYNAVSPELSAGDVDADWQRAESTGDETPGGHVATPDQDNVDEIGRAVGMEFQDNQELRTHEEIFAKRDRERWELNRSSAEGDSI
ncbi:MAG TPA: DUF6335 family protein [Blastocatellia bacterium]|nr:DUF6335 family protein [Blastocatellia bacterium]